MLLVFADPSCGPSDQLLPTLEHPQGASAAAQALVVSRGAPEANRAKREQHGLTFPIVLQKQRPRRAAYFNGKE